jgi:hypothetical protein
MKQDHTVHVVLPFLVDSAAERCPLLRGAAHLPPLYSSLLLISLSGPPAYVLLSSTAPSPKVTLKITLLHIARRESLEQL